MNPPGPNKQKLLGDWLAKAETDFEVAVYLVGEGPIFPSVIAFHCQQAAEKYIKAYLVWHEVDFPKTHDLEQLLDLMESVGTDLAESLRDVIVLTLYGTELRYPGDCPDAAPDQAREALELARVVRGKVLPLLPEPPDSE